MAVLRGRLAMTPRRQGRGRGPARDADLPIKAQIHAGGRGKAGRVKLARSPEEAHDHAGDARPGAANGADRPGGTAGAEDLPVEGCRIERELYLGMTLDRESGHVTLMASTEGGVEIEEVAQRHPEKILRAVIDPLTGLQANQARSLAFGLGLQGELVGRFVQLASGLYQAYAATDASLVEVNPLVVTADGALVALDAKIELDDNALHRHPELAELRDRTRSRRASSRPRSTTCPTSRSTATSPAW